MVQADLHNGALKPLLPVCHLLFSSLHSILHLLACHTYSAWGVHEKWSWPWCSKARTRPFTRLFIIPAMQADLHVS